MKIKNFKSIKNYGVFKDHSNGSLKDFRGSNIIFGWNYSGKTTLSRIVRSLELKKKPNGLENGKFKIQMEDNSELRESDIQTNNLRIRVFNSDYIRENLKWEQLSRGIQPILIIGEENIKLREKLDDLIKERGTTDGKISEINQKINSLNENIGNGLTTEARRISQELGLVRDFRKPDLEALIKSDKIESYLLDDAEFAVQKKTALSSDKLGTVSELSIYITRNVGLKAKELLNKTVSPSKTIDRLKNDQNIENWVRSGHMLHKTKDHCEFCGNKLPNDLIGELDSHFSIEYEAFRKEVEDYQKDLKNCEINLEGKLKSKNDFYNELQGDYLDAKNKIQAIVKKYNEYVKELFKTIEEKLKNLTLKMDLKEDCFFEFDNFDKAIEMFNEVVRKQEERTNNFENVKQISIEKLKKQYASQYYESSKYTEKQEEINTSQKELNTKKLRQSAIETEIGNIESKISETVKGSEVLNDYLKRYFGKNTSLEIRVINDQFHVYRDEIEAENLSEGEKTAISFAYFITTLHDKDTKDVLNETIVWVDDPISSLDHNHLYNTFSLISGCLKDKCKQLFLSTHNFEFFNLLKDDFAWKRLRNPNNCDNRENDTCKCSLFQINREVDNSTLQNVDCLLCRFKSEYQYIFYQLYAFKGSTGNADDYKLYTMPNMLRRFLETYIGFSVPSTKPWGNNLSSLIKEDEDMKFVYRLTNEMSHNENTERILKLYNTDEIRKAINITFDAFANDPSREEYFTALKTSVGL